VWVPHLSKRIHSIGAKTKSHITWILREVLLMAKVEMFLVPTISRMSDISIPLSLDMPKQELSFPCIREHTLQAVYDRLVRHHKGRNISLFRPLTVLIWRSGVLPLLSIPLILVGIFLTIVISFILTSIAPWTLIFEFMFFSISDAMVRASMDFFLHPMLMDK
jgi:hypothetical protein